MWYFCQTKSHSKDFKDTPRSWCTKSKLIWHANNVTTIPNFNKQYIYIGLTTSKEVKKRHNKIIFVKEEMLKTILLYEKNKDKYLRMHNSYRKKYMNHNLL